MENKNSVWALVSVQLCFSDKNLHFKNYYIYAKYDPDYCRWQLIETGKWRAVIIVIIMHNDMHTAALIHRSFIVQMGHKTPLSPLGQREFHFQWILWETLGRYVNKYWTIYLPKWTLWSFFHTKINAIA